jgi:integrase
LSDNYGNGKKAVKLQQSRAESPLKAIVLTETIGKTAEATGDAQQQQQDVKGLIISFMIKLHNEGIHDATIQNYAKMLRLLLERGADLLNPESVKEAIAKQNRWAESTKQLASIVYGKFAQLNGIAWKPPRYKTNRKIPFIPLESEVDSLICSCGKKLSALLRLLKESGIRIGEALRLEWKDIDAKNCTITLNNPEKHGVCRIFKVSSELIAMLNNIPKKSDRIFGNRTVSSFEGSFALQRRKAAIKLQNPRLLQIHFHTLRHFKATMEYAKTKDILQVMKVLGHRNIQNTLIYTQLINFESNEYHSATAKTIEEATQLIEAGFEYVCKIDNVQLFRKRK